MIVHKKNTYNVTKMYVVQAGFSSKTDDDTKNTAGTLAVGAAVPMASFNPVYTGNTKYTWTDQCTFTQAGVYELVVEANMSEYQDVNVDLEDGNGNPFFSTINPYGSDFPMKVGFTVDEPGTVGKLSVTPYGNSHLKYDVIVKIYYTGDDGK